MPYCFKTFDLFNIFQSGKVPLIRKLPCGHKNATSESKLKPLTITVYAESGDAQQLQKLSQYKGLKQCRDIR